MAIRKQYNVNLKGVTFKSGNFYLFDRYTRYENDPKPMFLFLYALKGVHPNTGHYHNYLQGFNLSYVPKKLRLPFVRRFVKRNLNPKTGEVKKNLRFPIEWFHSYMEPTIRRYLLKGNYIIGPKEVPFGAIEAELSKIEHKDFYAKAALARARRLIQRPMFRVKKSKRRRK